MVSDNKLLDRHVENFGVRSINFSVEKGFLLNGKPVKLKGACLHHDNGLLGSATYDRAEERRVEIMKANGFNAIRTSHNPPSKQFIDACDRLGMLVVDEAFDMWESPKNPQDYHLYFKENSKEDIESMVLRDRNHPSVILWSIGNEIPERADTSGVRISKALSGYIQAIDTTRPITAAICGGNRPWEQYSTAFQYLGVGGYNYRWNEYETDHKKYPNRLIVGLESIAWDANENWEQAENNSWIIGDFVWTGMDYLGESGLARNYYGKANVNYYLEPWPWFNAWCGDIDLCGFKKPQSYFRDVVWGQSKVEIAVHEPLINGEKENSSFWGWPLERQSWTWPGNEGKSMQVNVYTKADKVKLLLNDKILGEKQLTDTSRLTAASGVSKLKNTWDTGVGVQLSKLTTVFDVPYQPGKLTAVAYAKGIEIGTKTLITSGKAVAIKLTADRNAINANRNDLAYITVEAVDDKGNLVPDADMLVHASVSGDGELLATGNASPNDMKSFRKPDFKLFNGRGLIIVRPSTNQGNIEVKATSESLKEDKVNVKTK